MPDKGSVTDLLLLLRDTDPKVRNRAASELIQRYTTELLALIDGRMQQRLQQRIAPEDILQDVLLSFCKRLEAGGFDLNNRDQFLNLVVTIAVRKVCSTARREQRQRRDIRRELSLDSPGVDGGLAIDPIDPYTSPPDVITKIPEEIERLLAMLPMECREVASLRLEGYTTEEIARKINRTPRTVERRMKLIRKLWQGELPPADGGLSDE
ncbi:hypothetical protein FRUB_01882 [Fimbriiglobus ruber]|uniref:RNA polymerase sigma-70 ECF-like HTH domain-containing protein n=1 Tax=Fimbriiglobus ruber TaxID=1908690 RepID=A0A225DVY3_9BACT|nr:hypothetical protein FRUB_01882 [Fimbriiglobus ruber]